MSSVYLSRQPIVNKEEKLEAYEIMYVDANKDTSIDRNSMSASVINSILNTFGTKEFLSEHMAFVKIDENFLMSDLIQTIPTDFFMLSLFDDIQMSEKVIERIEQLYDKGFSLGIDDSDLNEQNILKYKSVLDKLSYFKINIYANMGTQEKDLMIALHDYDIKIVATNIDDVFEYETAQKLECDWYQGYCFATPQILKNKKFDSAKFDVLKLYNMLIDDTNIDEITSAFEENHALTLQLLRFINSANFHFQKQISSVHQILTLLGRKPLSQWLMLVIYSKSLSKNDKVSPLMLMVKNRTELMQNIFKVIYPDAGSNSVGEAYLVGVLSLMDTVFGAEITDILKQIHISDKVKSALLYDEGTLGELYKVVRDIEEFNISSLVSFSDKYKLKEEKIQDIILKSIEDVNSFEDIMQAS